MIRIGGSLKLNSEYAKTQHIICNPELTSYIVGLLKSEIRLKKSEAPFVIKSFFISPRNGAFDLFTEFFCTGI